MGMELHTYLVTYVYQIANNTLPTLLITGAYLSRSKAFDNIVPLCLCPLGVYDIHVEPVVDELMKQLLGSLDALDEHQHGRGKTLPIITDMRYIK